MSEETNTNTGSDSYPVDITWVDGEDYGYGKMVELPDLAAADNGGQIDVTPYSVGGSAYKNDSVVDLQNRETPAETGSARFTPNLEAAADIQDPAEKLRVLFELDDTSKSLLRQQLTERTEELGSAYAHNQPLVEQYKSVARGLYWMHAGEPGEALPDCFIPVLHYDDTVNEIRLRHDINPNIVYEFSDITFDMEQDLRNARSNETFEAAVANTLREAIDQAPGTALLESFGQPAPSSAERPLNTFEKQVRHAEIVGNVLEDYRMTPRDLHVRDDRARFARRDIHRGMQRLEDETVHGRSEQQTDDPVERAKAKIGQALIRINKEINTDSSAIPDRGKIHVEKFGHIIWAEGKLGSSDYRAEVLDTALREYTRRLNGGVETDPANRYFEGAVKKLFTKESDQALIDHVKDITVTLLSNDLLKTLSGDIPEPNSRHWCLATLAWLRQAKIDASREHFYKYAGAPDLYALEEARHTPRPLADKETFEALENRQVGSLEIDRRDYREKPPLQLIIARQLTELPELLASHPSSVLRLRLAADAFGNTGGYPTVPYLPGYRLAAMETGEQNVYDFVRDGAKNPYRSCDIPVSASELDGMVQTSRDNNLTAIADILENGNTQTIEQIIDAIRTASHYYIPEQGEDDEATRAYVEDGVLYGQCTTFADAARYLLNNAIDGVEMKQVSGLTIAKDSRVITAMAHEQLELIKDGNSYILDATPAGEIAEQARKVTLRDRYDRMRDGVGRLLRKASIIDYDLPESKRPIGAPAVKLVEEPVIPQPELKTQESPVSQLEQAVAGFSAIRTGYERQLAAVAGIPLTGEDAAHNRQAFFTYMNTVHGRDGDPFMRVLQRTMDAAPSFFGQLRPEELADDEIQTRISDISRDVEYVSAISRDPEIAEHIFGASLGESSAATLTRTLRELQRNYHVIADSRRAGESDVDSGAPTERLAKVS